MQHFTRVPDAVLDSRDIDRNAKLVLIILLRFANQDGECWPSIAAIARRARMSKSSVKRAIGSLVNANLLSYARRTEEGTDEPASNLYRLDAIFDDAMWGHGEPTYSQHEPRVGSGWTGGGFTVNHEVDPLKKKEEKDEAVDVLCYLNQRTGRNFRESESSLRPIRGRLREGFTADDCRAVVDFKTRTWAEDLKMRQYLRPQTLFRASNFESYLQAARSEASEEEHETEPLFDARGLV